MKASAASIVEHILDRYDALRAENFRLQKELEQEQEVCKNYWNSLVYLRATDCTKIQALPCPFCKSHHIGLEGSTCDAAWFVMCDCGAMGPECDSESAAISAWNKAIRSDAPSAVTLDASEETSI